MFPQMFPPKRILFPVDFSERCTDAARMVETFAGHFQAELTLLHVLSRSHTTICRWMPPL